MRVQTPFTRVLPFAIVLLLLHVQIVLAKTMRQLNRSQSRWAVPFYRSLTGPHTLTALVLIGVILRLWAYLANTALYLDEILLSYSILNLPIVDLLTRPLPIDQVAPLGFLLVERCSVTIFGHNEFALRLFPFVCAIISLILFRRIAERALTGAGPAV